jgi:hypothetical protein
MGEFFHKYRKNTISFIYQNAGICPWKKMSLASANCINVNINGRN